jgi:hypothetical protein
VETDEDKNYREKIAITTFERKWGNDMEDNYRIYTGI